MIRSALAAAAIGLPALAAGAEAQSYSAGSAYASNTAYENCLRQQRGRQVAGAVIGGVIGAVIGAEIHDDRQDRDRARHYYGHRHHGYYGRGHHRRHGYHRRHYGYYEDGNDGAVLAGAGLGALAGAALAGAGGASGCERYARAPHYGAAYAGDPAGYAAPARDGYGPGGTYDYGYDDTGYDPAPSSGAVLLGGEDYGRRSEARTYAAGSQTGAFAGSSGICRDMRSGNGALTWMCRGDDGVWRPAEVYNR